MVEVLVALVIMSIAAVGILGGIEMSVRASDINRKSDGGAYVRSWAEAIEKHVGAGNYVACAGADAYNPTAVGFDVPAGYTPTASTAQSVGATGVATACTTDTGTQLVTLTLATGDQRATETLAVILRKPCTGNSCTS